MSRVYAVAYRNTKQMRLKKKDKPSDGNAKTDALKEGFGFQSLRAALALALVSGPLRSLTADSLQQQSMRLVLGGGQSPSCLCSQRRPETSDDRTLTAK